MAERTSYATGEPAWTDLTTPEVEAAATFYATIFGWHAEPIAEADAGGYTMLSLDGRHVGAMAPQMADDQGGPRWSVYVATGDLDASLAAAEAAGGTVLMPALDVMDAGRMAILADPAGAVLSLWEAGTHPGAAVVDEPGALTWVELATTDMAAAVEFYGAVFGWGAKGSDDYMEFTLDGKSVAGLMTNSADGAGGGPAAFWLPYFQADVDRIAGEVTALGGTVVSGPDDVPGEGGRYAVVTDPHGATFGLYRP